MIKKKNLNENNDIIDHKEVFHGQIYTIRISGLLIYMYPKLYAIPQPYPAIIPVYIYNYNVL